MLFSQFSERAGGNEFHSLKLIDVITEGIGMANILLQQIRAKKRPDPAEQIVRLSMKQNKIMDDYKLLIDLHKEGHRQGTEGCRDGTCPKSGDDRSGSTAKGS